MEALKKSLASPRGEHGTGFEILKRDTSSTLSRIMRYIGNLINLLTPAFLHKSPSPRVQHEGHNIAKGFRQVKEQLEDFKSIKLQLKTLKSPENSIQDKQKNDVTLEDTPAFKQS